MTLAKLFQEAEECFYNRGCSSGVRLNETEENFVVEAVVAGVKPKDINISFEAGGVVIEAKGSLYNYSYIVPLPKGQIDEGAVPEAVAEEGILRVTFAKAKAAKPLKITVKGA